MTFTAALSLPPTVRCAPLPPSVLCRFGVSFDKFRDSAARLLLPWSVQGLWVFLLSLPVTLANTLVLTGRTEADAAVSARDVAGWSLWLMAWALEVVADRQKVAFAADKKNKGRFIHSGLWYYSRHPNYAGEMTLWFGLFLSASTAFVDQRHWLSVVGPCFNAFILRFVSGVPLLEKSSDKKWSARGMDARSRTAPRPPYARPRPHLRVCPVPSLLCGGDGTGERSATISATSRPRRCSSPTPSKHKTASSTLPSHSVDTRLHATRCLTTAGLFRSQYTG